MKERWKNGLLHCKNGPAIMTERLGQKYHEHWHYGELHRVDGPAVWQIASGRSGLRTTAATGKMGLPWRYMAAYACRSGTKISKFCPDSMINRSLGVIFPAWAIRGFLAI